MKGAAACAELFVICGSLAELAPLVPNVSTIDDAIFQRIQGLQIVVLQDRSEWESTLMFVLKDNRKRADYLEQWSKDGGVMILGYDMFRNLAGGKLPSYLVIVLVVVFNVVLDF